MQTSINFPVLSLITEQIAESNRNIVPIQIWHKYFISLGSLFSLIIIEGELFVEISVDLWMYVLFVLVDIA